MKLLNARRLLDPVYTGALRIATRGRGLRWRLDDHTTLRIDPRCRWIRHPGYEAAVVSYLRARIRPGHCCIDAGAHVGFYVLQMAMWTAPGGRVVAFEPNPTARHVLEANLALNHLASIVTVEPAAVGSAPGIAELFHADAVSGLSRVGSPNPGSPSPSPLRVNVVTLDDYCSQHAISPDWILIDVEGAELAALEGAAALLANTPVQVLVEMHGGLWDERQATASRFRSFLREVRRAAVPITGQQDAFADYGTIALTRSAS